MSTRYSRKRFLGRVGLGAAAAGTGGLVRSEGADARATRGQHVYSIPTGRFGRMFNGLPAFAPPTHAVEAALRDLGKPGGILDAKDALDKGRCS